MMVLITYDVETLTSDGKRRLRKVAKQCVNYGQRVQNSVFECVLDNTQFTKLKYLLENIVDKNSDSLRYYFLGDNWQRRVEHYGAKPTYDPEDVLIV